MCGVSGYFAFSGLIDNVGDLRAMNAAVAHRGPDGEGMLFLRRDTGAFSTFIGHPTPLTPGHLASCPSNFRSPHDLAFGHRRFAIIDLTPGGHQPFVSDDGLVALSFNGEIYNYLEIRAELEAAGCAFRTRSDAEVLLHAYRHWGELCFSKLIGFWAFALWDGTRKRLLLARDRLGKAPLYYTLKHGRLWWCSEIKGLRAALGRSAFPVRPEAVNLFVRSAIRDFQDHTCFEDIRSFPSAHFAWVTDAGHFELQRFWTPPQQRLRESDIGELEAVRELQSRLRSAVEIRLRSDAPVGLELSGGLDSSTLAALAAEAPYSANNPIAAFTVSFPGTAWDEEPFARQVLQRWPTRLQPHVVIPHAQEVWRGLQAFQLAQDEPFHSPNMVINQNIWRRMAAAGIRVSLNGAGGDEVFAGYGGEYFGPYLRHVLGKAKLATAWRALRHYSERDATLFGWLRTAWKAIPESWRFRWRDSLPPADLDPLRLPRTRILAHESLEARLLDHLDGYKMNYWLRSGNTSCMGVPMEVRLPLLDHRVVEWAYSLPVSYLIRDGWLKWILRQAADRWLPSEVTWRRVKMGFPFPLSNWLREVRPHLELMRSGEGPEFLDRKRLFDHYDVLARTLPDTLWRCLSVAMWWDRCVLGKTAEDQG